MPIISHQCFTAYAARYANGKYLVVLKGPRTGLKRRVDRLLGAMHARWTHREGGYIASPAQVKKLERYLSEGWDASYLGDLEPPKSNPVPAERSTTMAAKKRKKASKKRAKRSIPKKRSTSTKKAAHGTVVASHVVTRREGMLYYVDGMGNVRETRARRGGTRGHRTCRKK